MKRCWIGGALLLVLLAASLGVTWAMGEIHEPIQADLNRAAEAALAGDWNGGRLWFLRARDRWEQWEHFRACFADHTPAEDISAGFKALEVHCRIRELDDFAADCRELARKAAAMGEAHGLNWWNLL